MSTPPGWEGILDDSEQILWQGRPNGRFTLELNGIIGGLFGLFFAGFAVFWMGMATMAPGPFWMFGLPFVFAGAGLSFTSIYGPTLRRKNTWYTLTNKRAFIATQIPFKGRQLKSYPIQPDTDLEFLDGDVSTINFATITRYRRRSNRHGGRRGGYYTHTPVGFERIPDGRKVYGLMRDIQKGAA